MSHGSSIPFPNGFCQIKIGYHQHFGGTPFHHKKNTTMTFEFCQSHLPLPSLKPTAKAPEN